MLKITRQISADAMTFLLEGKLTTPWTEELDRYWEQVPGFQRNRMLVDLTGVTFIDSEGKALLTRMWQQGAIFRATGCFNISILEEITNTARADQLNSEPHT